MSYRVSMSSRVANLLAAAPPSVRGTIRRHLMLGDRERANAMKEARARLIFIFDEPMMLLEVGRYSVLYEIDPSSRTVRVRHAMVTPPAPPPPKASGDRHPVPSTRRRRAVASPGVRF